MSVFFKIILPLEACYLLFKDLFVTMEEILVSAGNRGLILMMVSVVIFWHIYTPIHELLHVFGAVVTGGSVESLALKPQYGGVLLAKVFPFVVPESDYAGQLTGFEVPCDLAYYLVDIMPYFLSLVGSAIVGLSRSKKSGVLFGLGLLLALVPLMSLPGDFYEASSLLVNRVSPLVTDLPDRILIHDDLFKLLGTLSEQGLLGMGSASLVGLGVLLGLWQVILLFGLQIVIRKALAAKFPSISGLG